MIDVLEKVNDEEVKLNEDKNIDINFNFLNEQNNKTETKNLSPLNDVDDLSSKVKVLLFCVNNDAFKLEEKVYNLKICGKSMKNWLLNSVNEFSVNEIEFDFKDDYLTLAKNNLDENFKYTLILFTDTPLLQHKTVVDIIEYFVLKNLSVLKFSRGYMFETSYLKTIDKVYNPQMQYFEEEDFITCYNLKQLAMINDIMHNRIISYHQKQGVVIMDPNTTKIDADVSIEHDVVISSNNNILGNTIIEQGAKIKNNNIICNSVIMQNSVVENSTIKDSIIGKECVVENYSVVINKSIIGDQSKLNGYNYIDNKKLARGKVLLAFEK